MQLQMYLWMYLELKYEKSLMFQLHYIILFILEKMDS